MKRDAYVIAQALISGTCAADSAYNSNMGDDREFNSKELAVVARQVASYCSVNMLENAIAILEKAIEHRIRMHPTAIVADAAKHQAVAEAAEAAEQTSTPGAPQ